MAYIGYYVNLDRCTDRRANMEAQLAEVGAAARYRRFPAVDGNPFGIAAKTLTEGELGCFYSHYLLLRMHLDGADHLHVIEDDIIMATRAPSFLRQVIMSGMLDDFDLLFTETAVPMFLDACRAGRQEYQCRIDRAADGTATNVRFGHLSYVAGMTSYLVNRRSIRLICDILRQELDQGARRPIDILIRDKAAEGKLRVQCLFPFVTSIRPGQFASSTTEDHEKRQSRFVMELLRHSYFVECDMKAAFELADQQLPNPDLGYQARLHYRLAAFVDSDEYRRF